MKLHLMVFVYSGAAKRHFLYKKHGEETGKAVQASAGHSMRELSCQFTCWHCPPPGKQFGLNWKLLFGAFIE